MTRRTVRTPFRIRRTGALVLLAVVQAQTGLAQSDDLAPDSPVFSEPVFPEIAVPEIPDITIELPDYLTGPTPGTPEWFDAIGAAGRGDDTGNYTPDERGTGAGAFVPPLEQPDLILPWDTPPDADYEWQPDPDEQPYPQPYAESAEFNPPLEVVPGRFTEVTLDAYGMALVEITTTRPARLAPAVFSPGISQDSLEFMYGGRLPEKIGADGEQPAIAISEPPSADDFVLPEDFIQGPLSQQALPPGRHLVRITASDSYYDNMRFDLRLTEEPFLDPYEPNDSLQDATPISTPFDNIIDLGDQRPDWFRISLPAGTIVGAWLRPFQAEGLYTLRFYNGQGEILYETPLEEWGHKGMRYYRSDGSPLYLEVVGEGNGWDNQASDFARLTIDAYTPDNDGRNAVIKLDMGDNGDGSALQLDFVAAAIGTRSIDVTAATEITTELRRVAEAPSPGSGTPWWLVPLGLSGVIAAAIAALLYFRHRKNRGGAQE